MITRVGSTFGPSCNGQVIQVRISDNGVGVPDDFHSQLFESQFSTKNREEGTGLGLNISRRFLRAVGGDIVFVP